MVMVLEKMYVSGTRTFPATESGSVAPGPLDQSSVKVTSPVVLGPAVQRTLECPVNLPPLVLENTPESQATVEARSGERLENLPWSPTSVQLERLCIARKTPRGADSLTYFVPFAATSSCISCPFL